MALSPMMQQYFEIKESYPDCILMFRLGDFYEMFFDDAKTASKVLDLVLTGRDCGEEERAPMCGVPFHSVEGYITKLISNGYRVAICEQTEDPSEAKGLVKREVVRIISPGTVTEGEYLSDGKNNYICSLFDGGDGYGIAFADVSTGELFATEIIIDEPSAKESALVSEASAFSPAELIVSKGASEGVTSMFNARFGTLISPVEESEFYDGEGFFELKSQFPDIKARSAEMESDYSFKALTALLRFVKRTQKTDTGYLKGLNFYKSDGFLRLDSFTRRNLELCESMRSSEKKGSLLWVLDKTKTSMGARLLKQWLDRPLLNCRSIERRQGAVAELKDSTVERGELTDALKQVVDIERLSTRLVYGTASPKELKSLEQTIFALPKIKALLENFKCEALSSIRERLDTLDDLGESIFNTIDENPRFSIREGGFIKKGANPSVDELRSMMTDGKDWILKIETMERERTGIPKLKIGYNKVFGYYIEVSKSYISQVPDTFIRRQTLANCERFVTPELKDLEARVIGARDRLYALEAELFEALRQHLLSNLDRLKLSGALVAELDVYVSLATVAADYGYVCPEVDLSDKLIIKDGRHPVVERFLKDSYFVPNDTELDCDNNRLALITGPNMAGKSTYMRQVALTVVMAQLGSFVPAKSARVGITDRVFTRVGASDDLATGTSTFMLEMTELAAILKNATDKSLIIYDEIGRGTSTYDGLSIAQASLEFTAKKIKAKTLFATHYHELTELEGEIKGVINYNVAAKKRGDGLVFLRKIVRGASVDSYGIEVAKLAGVPDEVLSRARQVLKQLEAQQPRPDLKNAPVEEDSSVSFEELASISITERLKALDLDTLTPIEAMGLLYEFKKALN